MKMKLFRNEAIICLELGKNDDWTINVDTNITKWAIQISFTDFRLVYSVSECAINNLIIHHKYGLKTFKIEKTLAIDVIYHMHSKSKYIVKPISVNSLNNDIIKYEKLYIY